MSAYRSAIEELVGEIESLSDTRHDYVHGAALEYAIGKSILSVTMGRLLQPTKKPRRMTITVTISSLAWCTNQLQAISDQLLDLAEAINRIDRLH